MKKFCISYDTIDCMLHLSFSPFFPRENNTEEEKKERGNRVKMLLTFIARSKDQASSKVS